MKQLISKREFDELMSIKGEGRGVAFKTEAEFILKEEGKQGLKKIENLITSLGYNFKYKEIKTLDFYPLGLIAVSHLAIQRLFNYDDKKFQEMGRFEAKVSFIIKLFMRYFVSLERVAKEVPKIWREYYTVGDLKVIELNKEKRWGIMRLENFRLHPNHCQDLIGYFPTVLQMIVKKKTSCKETKCVFRGDKYHEFLLKW